MTDLIVSRAGVIPQNEFTIRAGDGGEGLVQLFEAILQSVIVRLGRWCEFRAPASGGGDSLLVFEINFLGDAEEISSRVAGESGAETIELSRHTLDRYIGEILGKETSPRPKHRYQPVADRLVFLAGGFRIRTQPTQELFEGLHVKPLVGDNVLALRWLWTVQPGPAVTHSTKVSLRTA